MRVLLLYPQFPKSFWSFDKSIELIGRKVTVPPLGMITVAAILPQDWDFRLVDRNIAPETEADWEWVELVIVSGMIVQKLLIIVWRQGIKRNTRFQFWSQLFAILRHNPSVLISYRTMYALLEHHIDYRQIVQNEIEGQIADYRAANLKEKSQQVEMNESLVMTENV